jgi:hypothetical protein
MHNTSVLTKIIREELVAAIKRRLYESTPHMELTEQEKLKVDGPSLGPPPKYPRSFRPPVGKRLRTSKAYKKRGRLNKKTGVRTPVAAKKTKREEPMYFSAGTIPNVHGRKLSAGAASAREALGKKLLATHRRGDACGRAMRDDIKTQLMASGQDTKEPQVMSKLWAIASDAIAKGATDLNSFYTQYKNWGWVKVCTGKKKKKKTPSQKAAPTKKKAASTKKKKNTAPRTAF